MKQMSKETCMMCHRPAEWIRSTQFAGDHPFCDGHARLESGFGENDSYEYWIDLREEKNESED